MVDGDKVGINVLSIVVKRIDLEVSCASCIVVGGNDIVNIVVFVDFSLNPVVSGCLAFRIAEIHLGDNFSDVVISHIEGAFSFSVLGTDLITAKSDRRCIVRQGQRDVAESHIATDLIRINPPDVTDIYAQVIEFF